MLNERSATASGPGSFKVIDEDSGTPKDAKEIASGAQRVEGMRDQQARDKEYANLAIDAARSADLRLAEDFLSKIENEEIRSQTTIKVYSPVVRKALSETDWSQAQTFANKIAEPLGRTLALDTIARTMSRAGQDKQRVKEAYESALWKLQREQPSENTAKAFLALANSLLTLDKDDGFEAVKSAVYVLNKLSKSGDLPGKSEISRDAATWVSLPRPSARPDELMELTEMIGPLFKEMAKRDGDEASAISSSLSQQGLSSLAQLGIANQLLEEAATSRKPQRSQTSK